MTYLLSELTVLALGAIVVGAIVGWLLRSWWQGRSPAPPAADAPVEELTATLAQRDDELKAVRQELDLRLRELTAARRQLADFKVELRDTVGLEAELIAAREAAAKVPALQAQVAQLTAELGTIDLR